ncbi:MAG: TPM domain-containing protein [Eubacterium sp.]|nr:TPM domain-containing protein [Eubacterium sp.]
MKMKRHAARLGLLIAALLVLTVLFGTGSALAEGTRVVDGADILTDYEEDLLLAQLDEISERQDFDILVLTTNSLDGKTAEAYADDFWDQNGYGYGADRDGAMFLISMEEDMYGQRDWHIGTSGYGITALTDFGMDKMADAMLPYLRQWDFYGAASTFAEMTDEYVTLARQGTPVDQGSEPKPDYPWYAALLAALGLGGVAGGAVTGGYRKELKTVYKHHYAEDYYVKDSFRLNRHTSRDLFLYRNVVRTPRPKVEHNDHGGHGGGSTIHTSGGGFTHGGHSGKF